MVFIPMPEKCVVSKVWLTVEEALTAALDVTFEIGGTAITGSALQVASGGAAGDVDSAIPTALNEIAAGGTLEVIFAGSTTTTCSGTVLVEISKGT
jgi:hypothetical protein